MAAIHLSEVTLDFPIYGANTRSLKKQLIRLGTGGRIRFDENEIVTVRALNGVTLQLESGDRVGLIGDNGAGKSTLLRVLAGIYESTSGQISITGKVTALLDVMFGLAPESTGYENIILRGILQGLTRKAIKEKEANIAEFTGLGDHLSMPIRTYSSGMKLRLAFAIATSILPEILLLDEIVGVGDATFMSKAKSRIDHMVAQSEIVIVASHHTDIIEELCSKVLWMEAGKIIFYGPVKEGLSKYLQRH